MSRFDVLYVSPHADDVAFSTVGTLARDVAAGRRVGLLTLFRPGADDDRKATFGGRAQRSDEDHAFAGAFGVTLIEAGIDEAPARDKKYRRARALLAPLPDSGDSDHESETVALVQRTIAALIDEHTELVAPLGIGGHVDHQVAHRAVARLAHRTTRFYEDVPYVLVPYTLPRRFALLRWTVAGQDTTFVRARFLRELRQAALHFARMPFLQAAAPLPFRALAAASLVYREVRSLTHPADRALQTVLPSVYQAPEAAELADLKRHAAACYDSQWRLFFPSLEAMLTELGAYAQKMGHALVERSWTLAPADGLVTPTAAPVP